MGGRHSPWFVVAIAALVVALAGTAIAGPGTIADKLTKSKVKQIAGKQIKKAAPGLSVSHAKTADNAQEAAHADAADEATHATSATNANSALNAANAINAATAVNADNVDGYSLKPIYFASSTNNDTATVLDLQGLILKATCFLGAPPVVGMTARTTVDNSTLIVTNANAPDPSTNTTNIQNFDSGSDQNLFGGSAQTGANVTFQYATPAAAGQSRGAIVSGSIQIHGIAPLGATKTCLVSGTAAGIPAG